MTKTTLHKAETRGSADHGWLKAKHTFSFAGYYDPSRIHFGALRVLNDDYIEGGKGFGKHPHDNMEIITIPLEGDLEHKDSMGNTGVIKYGDVQVMSAGTGIIHSEFNANSDLPVKLLQIWVFPDKKNVTPRYGQVRLQPEERKNKLQQIVSPYETDTGLWIHQNAWFHLGKFECGKETKYDVKKKGNGVYLFVINGKISVEENTLHPRDGIGIWETNSIQLKADSDCEVLLMEVPMS